MEKEEIVRQLSKKVDESWNAYVEELLELAPKELIGLAEVISATRICRDQLESGKFAEHQLEHLLRFDDPLMAMREQWMEETSEPSLNFEHALWALWDHGPDPEDGPDPDNAPSQGDMEMG